MRGERSDHTLQATALVNEAYLRLIDVKKMHWQDRAHFLAMAAKMMRRILVDSARSRAAHKRGGGAAKVSITDALEELSDDRGLDMMRLDDALKALADKDPRMSRVVELRFFGGLSVEESAAVLDISPETVMRDWKAARAWLMREMKTQPDTRP
jgi:RNA polymerase sigma factor (TIGR02999 family)